MNEPTPILKPGTNCWKSACARRVRVFEATADFFEAVADAFEKAERSIFIIGWDLHSRVALRRREGDSRDVLELLSERARACPDLQVRVLIWDEDVIYALEREMLQRLRFWAKAPPNIRLCHDETAPAGASHHQKLIVVDATVAFVGGVDLAQRRWDTREHHVDDARRKTPNRLPFEPFHDAHTALSGPAVRLVEELARWRWRHATDEDVAPCRLAAAGTSNTENTDFEQIDVALARTLPDWLAEPEVREIESLWRDSITAARSSIYLENQYLSSSEVTDALMRRLGEPDGPEVVLVMPEEAAGLIEESTMDMLRAQAVRRLRRADIHDRLRVVYPVVDEGEQPHSVYVHAKVCVIDDRLLRVGSANLTNRSMGVDSECDLVIEGADAGQREQIRRVRNRFLGVHLGVDSDEIEHRLGVHGSLIAVIDAAEDQPRRLAALKPEFRDATVETFADEEVLDPERLPRGDDIAEEFVPEPMREGGASVGKIAGLLVVLVIVAVAWILTPLGEWLEPHRLAGVVEPISEAWWSVPVAIAGFTVLSVMAFPTSVLILAMGFVYGALWGSLWALVASLLSGLVSYRVGGAMGADGVDRLTRGRLRRMHRWVSERGVWSVVGLRMVPVAPYGVVNLAIGASKIPVRDFIWGTLIGLTPGIVLKGFFGDELGDFLAHPDPLSLLTLTALAAVFVAAGIFLSRWMRGKAAKEPEPSAPPEMGRAGLESPGT